MPAGGGRLAGATVTTSHTEPFHLSEAIATLDYVSAGRAGVRVKVGAGKAEADHIGRRQLPAQPLRQRVPPPPEDRR